MATILCAGVRAILERIPVLRCCRPGIKSLLRMICPTVKRQLLDRVQQITGQEIPFYQIDIKNENELSVILL